MARGRLVAAAAFGVPATTTAATTASASFAAASGRLLTAATRGGWALGLEERAETLMERAREEALACFAAAGIRLVGGDEFRERFQALNRIFTGSPAARSGNSSWQSLTRGATTIEAAYLNGEVALLGRLHGVPTPVNALLQEVATEVAASGRGPGARTLAERLGALAATPDAGPSLQGDGVIPYPFR